MMSITRFKGICAPLMQTCDFVIWTPNETTIERIPYDADWAEHTVELLGNIVADKLIRDEDADNNTMPMRYPCTGEKIPDQKHFTHPFNRLEEEIRGFTLKAFQIHITRWIHYSQTRSRTGMGWHLAVALASCNTKLL